MLAEDLVLGIVFAALLAIVVGSVAALWSMMKEAEVPDKGSGKDGGKEVVRTGDPLLEAARVKIAAGEGDQALGCVIHAIRSKYGEQGIMGVLDKAKAHVERERMEATKDKSNIEILRQAVSGEDTILSETYSDVPEALRDSVKSGDSRVCTLCGQVVATARLDAHSKYWCPSIPDDSD